MNGVVICDVIAVVTQRRGEEWHEPYRVDSQFLQIIELLFKSLKIADAVPVTVVKRANVDLIDDCILVPKSILIQWQNAFSRALPSAFVRGGQYASLYEATPILLWTPSGFPSLREC